MDEKIADVREFFATIQQRFVPEAARGVDMVFQYDIAGEGGGLWYAVVRNESLAIQEGRAEQPTVTMAISADNYLKVINGDLKGMLAYMTGKMKISGNKMAAQKFQKIVPVGK